MFLTAQTLVAAIGLSWAVYGAYRQKSRWVVEGALLALITVGATILERMAAK